MLDYLDFWYVQRPPSHIQSLQSNKSAISPEWDTNTQIFILVLSRSYRIRRAITILFLIYSCQPIQFAALYLRFNLCGILFINSH